VSLIQHGENIGENMTTFSHETLAMLERCLPAQRLRTYRSTAGGTLGDTMDLYMWNIDAAGAVLRITGLVEVLLRHTIDSLLRQWNLDNCGSEDWIRHPARPLEYIVRPQGQPTKWWENRSTAEGANPTLDDLVAGLPFGTWTSILPSPTSGVRNPRLAMWRRALSPGFATSGGAHEPLYRWAHELRIMRNRASHLRPLLDTGRLTRTHRYSIRLLRTISPEFAQWFAGLAWIPQVLAQHPDTPLSPRRVTGACGASL
jgi:hypothetical protein